MRISLMVLSWMWVAAVLRLPAAEPAVFTADQLLWFEKEVRPLLVERCVDCHGPHRHENGLRLDTGAGVLRGSDYGPVVVAGDPAASKLIRAVRGAEGVEKMPKKAAPLKESEIAILERWIAQGVIWPPETVVDAGHGRKADPAAHWAFQPVAAVMVPEDGVQGAQQGIDVLIGNKLRAAGLDFAPPAEPQVLWRRLHLSVTGLVGEKAELDAFLAAYAAHPQLAVEREVERLLNSVQYGQKWARHWLDVARYSDTEGYQAGGRDIRFPYAYTYRNWVIDALNEDMSYADFLKYQLAADLMVRPEALAAAKAGAISGMESEVRHLAALGFLTVNDRFLGDRLLQTDDRIDVVTRGMMGLTVACARCHDHKYDPIPSKDYYALYSIFNSSNMPEPDGMPVIAIPSNEQAVRDFEAAVAAQEVRREEKRQAVLGDVRRAGLIAGYWEFAQRNAEATAEVFRGTAGKEMKRDKLATLWRDFLKKHGAAEKLHPVLYPWQAFGRMATEADGGGFAERAPEVIASLPADPAVCNQVVVERLRAAECLSGLEDVARIHAEVMLEALEKEQWEDAQWQSVRALAAAGDSPLAIKEDRIEGFYTRRDNDDLTKIKNEVKRLQIEAEGAPVRAMAVFDNERPSDVKVMIRGNPGRQGELAPRSYLTVFGGEPFVEGSGRLQLAERIGSKDNPLTARVMVNRVWMQYFGKPLVEQTSDFGVQTERPLQADVLDYLAGELMKNDWSLKKLHRLILTSRTWQQSSEVTEEKTLKDADNLLISRMNRQRMDYEMMRDNLLAVSGDLNQALAPGRAVPYNAGDADHWRSVLLLVDRYDQPTVPAMFDFANPDSHSPQRFVTTVPQQALFLMNSPFLRARAGRVVSRVPQQGSGVDALVLRALYERVLLREPGLKELDAAQRYVAEAQTEWEAQRVGWQFGTLAMKEKLPEVPVEPSEGAETGVEPSWTVGGFEPFGVLDQSKRWSHTGTIPDPKWSYAYVADQAGHAGSGELGVAVRWTADQDVSLRVEAMVKRPSEKGDGIRAWLVTGEAEVLDSAVVGPAKEHKWVKEGLKLRQGESLLLVVGPNGDHSFDGFNWSLVLRDQHGRVMHSGEDFPDADGFAAKRPKPQSPLEQLAHVLLMSNEFQFID